MPPKKSKKRRTTEYAGGSALPTAGLCFYSAPGPKYLLKPVVGYEDHCVSKYRCPAYTIARKRPPMETIVPPGPGPKYLPHYPRSQGFSMGLPFTREKVENSNPGPYSLPDAIPGPAFSMSWRTKIREMGDESAGPYDIPRDLNGPAFTIGKLIDRKEDLHTGPLPRLTNVDAITPRSPAFSLQFRHRDLNLSHATPGPYDPVDLDKGPSFSFGVKHNPCFMPFITPCDKMY